MIYTGIQYPTIAGNEMLKPRERMNDLGRAEIKKELQDEF